MRGAATFCVVLLACLWASNASIVSFSKHPLYPDTEVDPLANVDKISQAMWAKNDTPAGDSDAQIKFKLQATQVQANGAGLFHILVFPYSLRHLIGVQVSTGQSSTQQICCVKEIEGCAAKTPGEIIFTQAPGISHIPVRLEEEGEASLDSFVSIYSSDIWFVYIINCIVSESGQILLTGDISFVNPYGYLSGSEYRLMPFYGTLALIYITVGALFGLLCVLHRKELIQVQYGILGAYLLSVLESASWYFYYNALNQSGHASVAGAVFSVAFTVAKKTYARTLLLLFSMGLGVAKSTIGITKYKVLAFMSAYFVFSLAAEVSVVYQHLNPSTETHYITKIILALPPSLLEAFFLWWVFVCQVRTWQHLTLRKQTLKAQLYTKFFYLLIFITIVTALPMVYSLFVNASHSAEEVWRTNWTWQAFWQIIFFITLVAVSWLWRPRRNNVRYGYSELGIYDDDDTEVSIPTLATSDMSNRNGASGKTAISYESDRERNLKETTGELNMLDTLSSFTISDDEGELDIGAPAAKMD